MRGLWRNWIIAILVVFGLATVGSLFSDREPSASTPASTPTFTPASTPTLSPAETAHPSSSPSQSASEPAATSPTPSAESEAIEALARLPIRGRAPKTGYSRELFSDGWGEYLGCDWRNRILARDLTNLTFRDSCIVATGTLLDPYSGDEIQFVRGVDTSFQVQIDHVVAVSDAWQKGAQQLTAQQRYEFYNDPLNLLAVSGSLNQQKSDSDAASWLPPNKTFRCQYVARQIAVKLKYELWVTQAEHDAMTRILQGCPGEPLTVG